MSLPSPLEGLGQSSAASITDPPFKEEAKSAALPPKFSPKHTKHLSLESTLIEISESEVCSEGSWEILYVSVTY